MIRGTSIKLNTRASRSPLRQSHSTLPRASEHRAHSKATNMSTVKTKSSKLSPLKNTDLSELMNPLEAWKDPEDGAQELVARERIKDCLRQGLNILDLSSLSLSTLPDVLGRMHHIQYLSIANNKFSEIPRSLANLVNLREFNISNNVLKEVPDNIQEFKKLELFNAACNQIERVSKKLAYLPKIKKVMLSHNRILKFPGKIRRIEKLELEDQLPLASFADFSPEFATQWKKNFQYEFGSANLEMWLARYEEILRMPGTANCRAVFKERIGHLLNAMMKNSNLRTLCYDKAENVIGTCHDGILFSLFEMEILQIEDRIIALQLSDDEIRQEMEKVFNFYRLQELAVIHSDKYSNKQEIEADALETVLFFYNSPANTLTMPLSDERVRFMRYPHMSQATDDDVRKAVAQIQQEKREFGQDFLINFLSEKEFWSNYLACRYADYIAEHTKVFLDQLERLETQKDQITEYDYLTQVHAIAEDKKDSERRLFYQLTRNIVAD